MDSPFDRAVPYLTEETVTSYKPGNPLGPGTVNVKVGQPSEPGRPDLLRKELIMASKTALPIARLRALGCRVSTIIGHYPTAKIAPSWQYGIVLPDGIELPIDLDLAVRRFTRASAHVDRSGRRILIRAFAPGDGKIEKAQREAIEGQVAGLLNKIADRLNGR